MQYPIMNLQDITTKKYPHFKKRGLDLLTQASVQRAVSTLFGEPGRVVHTMYFDGNQTTWAHRDGHYIDSQQAGKMIGVWIAAEDIHPEAGRFFILPRSHRTAVPGEQGDPNSRAYKAKMADFVREGPLDCVAPLLRQGDMLIWTSLTIHGSLPTTDARYSRRSFTAHYVPQSHQFQWNVREQASQRSIIVNGVDVILHGDDGSLFKRLRNAVRSEWPWLYGWARALAMQNPGLH
jgi:phytanoyl-CoA hydroxylase